MPNTSVTTKKHPTYKRKSNVLGVFFLISFISIYLSLIIFDINKGHFLHDPLIALMLILGVIFFVSNAFYPSKRCPECDTKTKSHGYLENKNIARICDSCKIIWDLGVRPPD